MAAGAPSCEANRKDRQRDASGSHHIQDTTPGGVTVTWARVLSPDVAAGVSCARPAGGTDEIDTRCNNGLTSCDFSLVVLGNSTGTWRPGPHTQVESLRTCGGSPLPGRCDASAIS